MESASSSIGRGGGGVCGDGVWGRLPQPLTENILARLPLVILAQLRLVCKAWNSIILSDAFTELRTRINPTETWFLISWKPQKSIVVYDPCSRLWHEMPAHSLLERDSRILATAGGLLFGVSYLEHSSGGTGSERHCCHTDLQFTVCNPLTGSWRRIARNKSVLRIYNVGMTYNHQSNSYLILLFGFSAKGYQYLSTEVYESSSDGWRDGDEFVFPESEFRFDSVQREAVWFQGLFFFQMDDTVHAYDLHKGGWTGPIAKVPENNEFISLLSYSNSLLMVTERPPQQQQQEAGDARLPFRMWELEQQQSMAMQWVEKQMAAPGLASNFINLGRYKHCYVFGEGQSLCLWTREEDFRAFAYDCSNQQWHQLPRTHLLDGLDLFSDHLCMPFQPSFKARV